MPLSRASTRGRYSRIEGVTHMPSGDPGASSSGACDAPPEALVADEMWHAAPEAEAPGASGGRGETVPGCLP